jgi:hypothetical protein
MRAKLVKESLNELFYRESDPTPNRYSSGKISQGNAFTDFDKEQSAEQRGIGEVDAKWLTPLKKFTAIIKGLTNPEMVDSPKLLAKYGFDVDDRDFEGKAYQTLVDMYQSAKNAADHGSERGIYLEDKYYSWLEKTGLLDIIK